MRYIVTKSVIEGLWYVMDTVPNRPKMISFFRGDGAKQEAYKEAHHLNATNEAGSE